jgi:hypothetical protein
LFFFGTISLIANAYLGIYPNAAYLLAATEFLKKVKIWLEFLFLNHSFLTVLKSSVAAIKTRFKRIEKKVFKKTHFVPYLYYFSCLFVDLASSKFLERKKHKETQRRKIPIWQHFFLIEFFFFPKLH